MKETAMLAHDQLLHADVLGSLAYLLFQIAAFVCFCFFLYAWVREEYIRNIRNHRSRPKRTPRTESG
jgi:Gpi18-like mannosyltransferase